MRVLNPTARAEDAEVRGAESGPAPVWPAFGVLVQLNASRLRAPSGSPPTAKSPPSARFNSAPVTPNRPAWSAAGALAPHRASLKE